MSASVVFDNAFDFEKVIGMEYQRMGFDVQLNSKQNEPGYDLLATKNGMTIAVQVKNYKNKLPISAVLKFRDFMETSDYKYGAIISATGFSVAALTAIRTQKLKNFQMGHFSSRQIVWDYMGNKQPLEPIEPTKPHYISIFTAKGGVGKTIVSAHLAGAFALSGYRVNIVDGDPEENLYGLTGDTAIVPNSRTGKNSKIEVLKIGGWNESLNSNESITIFDCSPAIERNKSRLFEKTESFIIPTSLSSPLDIGNNAEVLLRTIKQIREINKVADIFILLNKYNKPTAKELDRLRSVKYILSQHTDEKCIILDPEEVSIRESTILKKWGSEPDLAFKTIGGRCHPRDDFLRLSEYLLDNLTINQLRNNNNDTSERDNIIRCGKEKEPVTS
ncbi:MAG: restriction endonuclease [Thiotrichaceae bacterium]|nr:restriction endonuclease [Thiotrichaceae bacterium]